MSFVLRLFNRLELKRLDGGGDIADLVLTAETRQHHVKIAPSHKLDRTGDPYDWFSNPAADEEGSRTADDDHDQHDNAEHKFLMIKPGIIERDFAVANILAALCQIVGQLFD